MTRGNLTTICTVMSLERRLLICLVVALVVASASTAWGDTSNWTFTTAGNYTVSDATKVEIADGVAKLIAVDQTDDNNTPTGFGGGTHNETQWDGTDNWLELTATGQTNGSGDFISRVMDAGATAAWNSISWIPQRPLYKELPDNTGIESAYPTGNADMTENVLLMHFKRPEGMELPNYGEIETFDGGANMTGNVLLTHMNEASGTVVDYSGEGNNGTLSGEGDEYGAGGKFNNCLDFDGNDYVAVSGFIDLDGASELSVEMWMKQDQTTQGRYSLWRDGNILINIGDNYGIPGPTNLRLRLNLDGNWRASHTAVGVLDTGVWHHWAFVYDGTYAKIYKDGQEIYSSNADASYNAVSTGSGDLEIGFRQGQSGLDGLMDEVAIYNRGLSPEEILDHYLRGIASDFSGEGNNGTIMGAISAGGKFNTALSFDGVDDYVEVPDSSSLDITDAVTIEAWIYSTDFKNQNPGIVTKWDWSSTDPQRSYCLYLGSFDQPVLRISSDGTYQDELVSATVLATDTWYHLTGVFTGSKYIVYINGAWDCELNVTKTIHSGTAKLSIGASMKDDTVATDETFNGIIDEVAIYNRPLSGPEILDHYKRGALRLKYQVRSCDDSACDTEQFIGPDGTAGTYYSELSNSTLGLPFLSLTNVANNRYFQYRAYLEADNSSYSPELKSVVIGPAHYPVDNPTVQNNTGQTYAVLDSLVETLGVGNAGSVKYQISDDGTNWYYWNASNWVAASGYSQTNTAAEVNTNCGQFDDDVGTGDFYFKAFLHSDTPAQQVEVDQVDLGYTSRISVSASNPTFTFGTNLLNTWLSPQTSVITNDGTVAENFVGSISQLTDGTNNWGISDASNGIDIIRAQWSTTSETGPWTDIAAYDTDFTIATNVAVNDSVTFWFRIQTPISTSSYNQHSSTLTVTAQQY